MGDPCGLGRMRATEMPVRHGVAGRPRCSRRRYCRGVLSFAPRRSFTLLGLDAYCAVMPDDRRAQESRRILADGLMLG